MTKYLIISGLFLCIACGSASKSHIVSKVEADTKVKDSIGFDLLKSWGYDFKLYDPTPCGCPPNGYVKSTSTPRKSKYLMENPYKWSNNDPIVIDDPKMIEWLKKRSKKVEKKKDTVPVL